LTKANFSCKIIKNRMEREFPMIAEIRKAALGIK